MPSRNSDRSLLPRWKRNGANSGSDVHNGTGAGTHNGPMHGRVVPKKMSFGDMHPMTKAHLVSTMGEFIGTIAFLWFAFAGTQVAKTIPIPTANRSENVRNPSSVLDTSQILMIALSFGFSLSVTSWVFYRISGGLFNPAVTLGLLLIGQLTWFRAFLLFVAQMLGGIAAAGLVSCMFPGPLNVTTTTRTGSSGTSLAQGLFIEAFLTWMLCFTVFMLAAEKHKATYLAPIGIGLALFIAELAGVYNTGGSLNPARSFGPAVINRSFQTDQWIYWVGPALGAVFASLFYKLVKRLDYQKANPGQDREITTATSGAGSSSESSSLSDGGHRRRSRKTRGTELPAAAPTTGVGVQGTLAEESTAKPTTSTMGSGHMHGHGQSHDHGHESSSTKI